MAPKVRISGSRHTGLAAPPHRNNQTIKKHMDRLESADCFGDFLDLGLGKPEYLEGYKDVRYSLHVAPNARLIIGLDTEPEKVRECTEFEVKGVCDYHGRKTTWYIP